MVETAGEVFIMVRLDCGITVCMEKVEGFKAVLSLCFGFAVERAVGASSKQSLRGQREGSLQQVRCDTMIKWSR